MRGSSHVTALQFHALGSDSSESLSPSLSDFSDDESWEVSFLEAWVLHLRSQLTPRQPQQDLAAQHRAYQADTALRRFNSLCKSSGHHLPRLSARQSRAQKLSEEGLRARYGY